jgi:AbrB family looped-hinge helix DNA binding protein
MKQSAWEETVQTTLDRFGRIVLPKKLRDDFNLEPGSQIQIEESGLEIILKPVHGEPNLRLKDGVLVFTGIPFGDLNKAVAKHRDERL